MIRDIWVKKQVVSYKVMWTLVVDYNKKGIENKGVIIWVSDWISGRVSK